ncbi:MAG: 3'-5' exonuclease, partial [Alphaproteobacteria bacterium]|nr:3'-5' exonuclease [Alphaproteobacteria bacterium]
IAEIARSLGGAWNEGLPVIAYNACFDLTVLDREMRRHGFAPLTPGAVVDPLVIDRQVDRYRRGKRTLEAACARYDARLDGAHDAGADAIAAARVAWRLAKRYPDIAGMTLDELHRAQVEWKREQSDSLREYWREIGDPRAGEVDGSWPVVPYAGVGVPA